MLEHSALLVYDWTQAVQPDGKNAWIRRIADAAAQPLGFVRCERHFTPTWLSWLRKVRLDVFETQDASHLMSLTRSST